MRPVLQPPTLQKEQLQVFCVFSEQLLYDIILERQHCHEVTLVKKYDAPLLQKKTRKDFIKKLVQSK